VKINHTVEKPDGSVVFQGVLSGDELAFVIEMGMDTILKASASPFVSTRDHELHDIHGMPEESQ